MKNKFPQSTFENRQKDFSGFVSYDLASPEQRKAFINHEITEEEFDRLCLENEKNNIHYKDGIAYPIK